ncbi:shikimate dehydrogenase [Lawsonibacter asaccharolyticus]
MAYITVDTKLVVLLGTPLRQSVSYLAQNRVYERLGLDYYYIPVEVKSSDQLRTVVAGLKQMNLGGLAVTKPYKETILQYLDGMDETARQMGACNTVVVRDGAWIGYNTDGMGCARSLKEEQGFDPVGKHIFSYGAGGAARAVLFQLAAMGAKTIVTAALDGMALRLAEELNQFYPGVCRGLEIGQRDQLARETEKADLVLNLTGLGMAPHLEETPMDCRWLRPGQLCYDAIYQPKQTRFLREAEKMGCRTLNGLGMVIYQGVEQIALWTGREIPSELMYQVLENDEKRWQDK